MTYMKSYLDPKPIKLRRKSNRIFVSKIEPQSLYRLTLRISVCEEKMVKT